MGTVKKPFSTSTTLSPGCMSQEEEDPNFQLTEELIGWAKCLHHPPGGAALRQTWVLIVPPFTKCRTLVKGLKISETVSSDVKVGTTVPS